MRGAVLALVAGCTFDHGFGMGPADANGSGSDSGSGNTNDSGMPVDAYVNPVDGPTCTSTKFLNLCAEPPPTAPFNLNNATIINTDTDSRCRVFYQPNGGPVCLIYATSVDIMNGGSITAIGSRPLAIASTSTMFISGTIDVSSRRAGQRGAGSSNPSCTFASAPESDIGGGGGGAGGSFGLHGANGGTGDTDTSLGLDGSGSPGTVGPTATIVVLRGGCRGQQGGDESSIGARVAAAVIAAAGSTCLPRQRSSSRARFERPGRARAAALRIREAVAAAAADSS